MNKQELQKMTIPDTPGVYFFLSKDKGILYIGKATSLKNRVGSYFTADIIEKRSELIGNLVKEAYSIEWTETDSVLEALILETNLIRTHKPKFNTKSKDDKSYNHLVITNEEFPRVLVVRGKDITEKFTEEDIRHEFGPYPSGQLLREALKIVRKIFKFYDTKKPLGTETSKLSKGKITFNQQIGLYPNITDKKEYLKTIKQLELFFKGNKKELLRILGKEMKKLAKEEKFEQANVIKNKIFALQHIQDISLLKVESRHYRDEKRIRIEGYDIAHLQGESMVGVMTVFEGGEAIKSDYRKFKIRKYDKANDPGALKEVLERRFAHDDWPMPQLVVVDGNMVQKRVAEKVISEAGQVIPVVAVVKDDKHKPNRLIGQAALLTTHKETILHANAEAHRFALAYHKQNRKKLFLPS